MPSSGCDTSPMLTLVSIPSEPIRMPSSSAPERIFSATTKAPTISVSGSSTTNSSPPYLYAVSTVRIERRITAPSCRSTSSPRWWPRESLTSFRPSRSIIRRQKPRSLRRVRRISWSSVAKICARLKRPVSGSDREMASMAERARRSCSAKKLARYASSQIDPKFTPKRSRSPAVNEARSGSASRTPVYASAAATTASNAARPPRASATATATTR